MDGQIAVTIVLADDHALVRQTIEFILAREQGFRIVACVGDVPSAIGATDEHRPNILVLDLSMPGGSSLQAIPTIRASSPDTRIVVLTMHNEPVFARHALAAGAHGYVLKDDATAELVPAVRAALDGTPYVSSQLETDF